MGVVVTSWIQLAQWEGLRKGDLQAVFGSSVRRIEGRVQTWPGPE